MLVNKCKHFDFETKTMREIILLLVHLQTHFSIQWPFSTSRLFRRQSSSKKIQRSCETDDYMRELSRDHYPNDVVEHNLLNTYD